MTDIPITANERKAQFTGNTGLGPFAFTFNVLVASDLRVLKNNTVLTITTEYTVSLNVDGTGSITLTGSGNGTALISSDILTIIGGRQLARTSDYVQGGNLFAGALNEDLDSIVIMMQQLDEKVSRTMRIDAGDVGENLLLPSKASRLNRVLQFNSVTGDPEAGPTAADVANAQTNATNAAASAAAAASSASAAAGSASAAAGSASAAASSESHAASSESAAQAAQAAAEAAQAAAETAETNAETAETNAASSASAASTSASNAASSASAASTSASNAATSETNASNSATAAASSASAASASQIAAAASAAAAAASYDTFDDRYLGTKTSDPTLDNDGNALVVGALYFNSVANEMRVYDGANWIAASSAGGASLLNYNYTATAGQTTFSGADDNAATLSYVQQNLIVTLNGIVLEDGTDYTASNGTSIVLSTGAAAGDELNVVAFKSFTTADMVPASTGGTFSGNVAVNGSFSVDGGTIKLDGNYPVGTNNVALGDIALGDASLSGGNNTAIGRSSLFSNTSGASNTGIGSGALENNTTASNNTAVGYQAGLTNATGSFNVAIGNEAMRSNSAGNGIVAVGHATLRANTASNNTAVGMTALNGNTTGTENTAIGGGAFGFTNGALGLNTSGSYNTALGSQALLNNTTASSNTALGYVALYSNQTGASNTAVGRSALYATTGGFNTAIGENAGGAITTGTKNTILGRYNGNQGGLDIRTSSNYIVLSDGDGNPRGYHDATNWYFPSVDTQTTGSAANVNVGTNGVLRRSTSSLKYKREVQDTLHGLAKLLELRPVVYKSKSVLDGETIYGGLIAEEVHDAGLTEFVQYAEDGSPDALAYGNMVSLCIKAIQDQQDIITALEARITALEAK